jgi:hypothetical protein
MNRCPNCHFYSIEISGEKCGYCFKMCEICEEYECLPHLDVCEECNERGDFIAFEEPDFPDWSLSLLYCATCSIEIDFGDYCSSCEISQCYSKIDDEYAQFDVELTWREFDEYQFNDICNGEIPIPKYED